MSASWEVLGAERAESSGFPFHGARDERVKRRSTPAGDVMALTAPYVRACARTRAVAFRVSAAGSSTNEEHLFKFSSSRNARSLAGREEKLIVGGAPRLNSQSRDGIFDNAIYARARARKEDAESELPANFFRQIRIFVDRRGNSCRN
jgi:hypothetical protein